MEAIPITGCDLLIIGAGAAGLTAAIFAGETAAGAGRSIVVLEGARKPGSKILISGGGRCNVTNAELSAKDYSGGSAAIIRNVLRAFDQTHTVAWMRSLGADLRLEQDGKYFPVTGKAGTVLDALLRRVRELEITIQTNRRAADLRFGEGGFRIYSAREQLLAAAPRVILCTGGMALPESGTDGAGYEWLKRLGHSIVPTTPALAPLALGKGIGPAGRFREFSGLTMDVRLSLHSEQGGLLAERTGSLVFTHFGVSGPAAMDISRHVARYRLDHPGGSPRVSLGHPSFRAPEAADTWLVRQSRQNPKRAVHTVLSALYPERFARALAETYGCIGSLTRPQRRALAESLSRLPVDVTGDLGYGHAEATAGGADLGEIRWRTMESRIIPGLYLCGEILDADGRVGGYNLQWAWATGCIAGKAAAMSL